MHIWVVYAVLPNGDHIPVSECTHEFPSFRTCEENFFKTFDPNEHDVPDTMSHLSVQIVNLVTTKGYVLTWKEGYFRKRQNRLIRWFRNLLQLK